MRGRSELEKLLGSVLLIASVHAAARRIESAVNCRLICVATRRITWRGAVSEKSREVTRVPTLLRHVVVAGHGKLTHFLVSESRENLFLTRLANSFLLFFSELNVEMNEIKGTL